MRFRTEGDSVILRNLFEPVSICREVEINNLGPTIIVKRSERERLYRIYQIAGKSLSLSNFNCGREGAGGERTTYLVPFLTSL